MLARSVRAAAGAEHVAGVVVVVPEPLVERAAELAERAAGGAAELIAVLPGGSTRQESSRIGLSAVPAEASVVVCHDAARPFAAPDLFDRVIAAVADPAAGSARGAIPVVAVPDTVKGVADGFVSRTVPRGELALAQTPQAFDATALREAHRRALAAGVDATDDAMLLEAAGFAVAAVPGDPANFKVTTPEDLERARAVVAGSGRDG